MPDPQFAAFKGFARPMDVVDSTDMPYEARLTILQEWQSALAHSDSGDDRRDALLGAIHALEMGAVVQDDGPDGAPDTSGYGLGDSGSRSEPRERKS